MAKGEIHYFIAPGPGSGGGPGASRSSRSSDSAIASWVEAPFTAKTISGQSVYDLTTPR